ncbi:MAG: hypothetical protein RL283_1388 [Actinomycetota bacterium]|jgi:Lrp/AsnC family leucine-responsive transcriptional regulator
MARESVELDRIDREILGVLREDGRIPWQTLGDRVHLSANAAADRVRRLLRRGVIRGFRADVDHAVLGRSLEAVVRVRMSDTRGFDRAVGGREDVVWAAHVTGSSDVTLSVACDGTAGLDALISWLVELGATETRTDVVLRRAK